MERRVTRGYAKEIAVHVPQIIPFAKQKALEGEIEYLGNRNDLVRARLVNYSKFAVPRSQPRSSGSTDSSESSVASSSRDSLQDNTPQEQQQEQSSSENNSSVFENSSEDDESSGTEIPNEEAEHEMSTESLDPNQLPTTDSDVSSSTSVFEDSCAWTSDDGSSMIIVTQEMAEMNGFEFDGDESYSEFDPQMNSTISEHAHHHLLIPERIEAKHRRFNDAMLMRMSLNDTL